MFCMVGLKHLDLGVWLCLLVWISGSPLLSGGFYLFVITQAWQVLGHLSDSQSSDCGCSGLNHDWESRDGPGSATEGYSFQSYHQVFCKMSPVLLMGLLKTKRVPERSRGESYY